MSVSFAGGTRGPQPGRRTSGWRAKGVSGHCTGLMWVLYGVKLIPWTWSKILQARWAGLVGKREPTEMSQLLWMQPARSSPTLWFGQDKTDKKHLEVIWEIATLQPWGLLLRRRWGWGLKKAHQHQTPSSLVSRGMLWKGLIDETQGRLIQNKACRHSSHCRVFLNDSCARVCVCRRSRDCWLCLHTFPCPELTSLGRWVPRNKLS